MDIITYDGLDILIKTLDNNEGLTNHLIENTLFFHPDIVIRQSKEMHDKAQNDKLPVRFSRAKSVYSTDDGQTHKRLFKNKTEAVKVSERENIYTTVRPGVRIHIDKDGNYCVRQQIKQYTGEIVSAGKISTIRNYTISHIWGNTNDPYFFSALWNITLTPMHCSFILDKPDSHHKQIRDIKGLFKAICWELYRPDKLMEVDFVDVPERRYIDQARFYINNQSLNLIPRI